jgi:hypothetical protein
MTLREELGFPSYVTDEELGFPSYVTDAIEYCVCPIWCQVIQATSQFSRSILIRKGHSVSSQRKGVEN